MASVKVRYYSSSLLALEFQFSAQHTNRQMLPPLRVIAFAKDNLILVRYEITLKG